MRPAESSVIQEAASPWPASRLEPLVSENDSATRVISLFPVVPKQAVSIPGPDWPQIRGYELLSVIGSGGMGIVYMARHRTLQRTVALKMLRQIVIADPELHHRFRAEAEAVARLQHPNIIQVFEFGMVESLRGDAHPNPFMALEFVDGGSLATRTDAPQAPRYAASIVEKLARAVQAAHRLGVIHRDLKPANVLLTREGEPKIADFGLAKQLTAERDAGGKFVTQAGIVMGTPEYIAPEQVAGEAPAPAIDIYALGVILYELLTGRVPFQGANLEETIYQVCQQEPVSPCQLQPGLPRDLDTICLKCLQKDPGKRYESAEALADDLARWMQGLTIRARPVGLAERTANWARRNPAVAALSAAVVVVALAGLVGVTWKWREAQTHANEADNAAAEARAFARGERWERYRANIVAASSALQVGNLSAARQALDAAPEEYRNWEWDYFHQQCSPPQEVLRWPGAVASKVIVTPDGATVAMLNVDDSVRVWDVRALKEVKTFAAARDQANMTLSPDGKTLAYPSGNNCVLRDLATDRIRLLGGHEKRILTIRFSLDGRRVATLVPNGNVRVWDVATGSTLLVQHGGEEGIGFIELSEDGQRLAGSNGREVHIWDVETGRQTTLLGSHEQVVMTLRFNRKGDRLLTLETYPTNTIRLWDATTGKLLAVMRGHANQVNSLAFSPDDTRIASGGMDQTVRLWDAATGNLLTALHGHKGWVHRVAFSPDGRQLLTASQDHTIRLWDAKTGTQLAVLGGHEAEVYDAVYTPDGAHVVSGSRDGTVRLWDVQSAEYNGTLRGHTSFVYGVAFHRDGQRVASAGWDGMVRIWDVTTGRQTLTLNHGEGKVVSSVAFQPGGRLLASICRDDSLRLWDVVTGELVQRWSVPTAGWRDTRLAFSPQGDLLAAGGTDGVVRLWDVNRRVEVAKLRGHRDVIRDVAFSPDGRWLASAGDSEERTIRIWDVARREQVQVLEGHMFGVYALTFRGDSRLLASGSTDGTVRLWDTATWQTIGVLKHGTNVYGVAFTPDGTRLASACADSTIRFWDVGTQQEVAELRGHEAYVHALCFSPDGTRLVSASGDCTVRIWNRFPVLAACPEAASVDTDQR